MIYYSSQLIEMDQQLRKFTRMCFVYDNIYIYELYEKIVGNRGVTMTDELRTGETITRMGEIIAAAAQKQPVSLVVTGDDLSKRVFLSSDFILKSYAF